MRKKSGVKKARKRTGKIKIVGGILLSMILLIGAGLLIKTIIDYTGEDDIRKVLLRRIETEQKEIVMTSDTEGTVEMIVTVPDFTVLAQEAAKEGEDGFSEYFTGAIKKGDYETVDITVTAEVEVIDGKTVVYEEEAVDQALDKVLTEAANMLWETEE